VLRGPRNLATVARKLSLWLGLRRNHSRRARPAPLTALALSTSSGVSIRRCPTLFDMRMRSRPHPAAAARLALESALPLQIPGAIAAIRPSAQAHPQG